MNSIPLFSGPAIWGSLPSRAKPEVRPTRSFFTPKDRYANWPETSPLPLEAHKDVNCGTAVMQHLNRLWQKLTSAVSFCNPYNTSQPVTELMMMPIGPVSNPVNTVRSVSQVTHYGPVQNRMRRSVHFGAPRISVPGYVRIPLGLKPEKQVILSDSERGEQPLSQYGNLNEHGAFWLQNSIGLPVATLRRERASRMLGNTAPQKFYAIELDVPGAVYNPEWGVAIENYLMLETMQQARKHNLRIAIKPESPEARAHYKQWGFVTLEKALQRYAPPGQSNRPSRDMQGWLAYDGFWAGYPSGQIRQE